jgi:3-phenylpropionate/trans-cinnamate dioxygenase ferredoxin subunit
MSEGKKYKWIKVADTVSAIEWQENNMALIEANGKTITLARHHEKLFGVAHKCPHAGGIVANGCIDAVGNVVCPLHRYKFSMANGRNVSGEGYYLKTYPVEVNENGVYIGVEEKTFFNWL